VSWTKGELYRCLDPGCACEIEVTRGCGGEGFYQPRCCCGKPMERVEPARPAKKA